MGLTARPDRLLRSHLRDRFLITTLGGATFEGVVLDADDRHVVLADAEQVSPTGDRLKVDGHLWLPRDGIDYLQQPK